MHNATPGTEAVWRAFSKPLRAFVSRRVRRAADADDILQDVFVRIHRNLASVREKDNLSAWLFQITRNAIADYYRSRRREDEPLADDFELPAPPEHDAGEQDAIHELSACLAPMIAALPEKYREALVMADLNGLSQQEAAQQTGVSLSGMKSRVQRARRQVKDMLLACCRVELDRRSGVMDISSRSGGGCCGSNGPCRG